MAQKKRKTSVELTAIAQKIKDEYIDLGLKNILSAGLILFHIQSEKDKLLSIRVANDKGPEALTTRKAKLKILSPEESAALADLRKALGPSSAELAAADEIAARRDSKAKKRSRGRRRPSKAV